MVDAPPVLIQSSYAVIISPPSNSVSLKLTVIESLVAVSSVGAGGLTGTEAALICVMGEKGDQPFTLRVRYLNRKIEPEVKFTFSLDVRVKVVSRLSSSKPISG